MKRALLALVIVALTVASLAVQADAASLSRSTRAKLLRLEQRRGPTREGAAGGVAGGPPGPPSLNDAGVRLDRCGIAHAGADSQGKTKSCWGAAADGRGGPGGGLDDSQRHRRPDLAVQPVLDVTGHARAQGPTERCSTPCSWLGQREEQNYPFQGKPQEHRAT